MESFVAVRKDSYFDSVLLMRISRGLQELPGISDAVVAMATPQNKALLESQSFAGAELASAGPNDLVIAVRGESVKPAAIHEAIEKLLKPGGGDAQEERAHSLRSAVRIAPDANLAVISVPGIYAAREARKALRLGLHVMLFSDNVPVEDEIELKHEAADRGLLMMGPDCGTAIINGRPLAFANVVRRGRIGIVGASGTGIQEISCCIHHLGGGISQAIGTGGRDLSDKVGGIMTLAGIKALAADPDTKVLVVVSKPPSPSVANRVIEALRQTGKPAVVHFVGRTSDDSPRDHTNVDFAYSLAGTAEAACMRTGISIRGEQYAWPPSELVSSLASRLARNAKLRGLFCGGTTGQEALALLTRAGLEIRSNLHKGGLLQIDGTRVVSGHVVLDLGADEFTMGRPHPMIEPMLRNERLEQEMADPETGILLFDCVLGYGSHDNPAGMLAEGFARAQTVAHKRGATLAGVASVTGTPDDPQGFAKQVRTLELAGIVVAPDNRNAVALVSVILKQLSSGPAERGVS
jgi:succinyl-CoA synthetase alpha subunit